MTELEVKKIVKSEIDETYVEGETLSKLKPNTVYHVIGNNGYGDNCSITKYFMLTYSYDSMEGVLIIPKPKNGIDIRNIVSDWYYKDCGDFEKFKQKNPEYFI